MVRFELDTRTCVEPGTNFLAVSIQKTGLLLLVPTKRHHHPLTKLNLTNPRTTFLSETTTEPYTRKLKSFSLNESTKPSTTRSPRDFSRPRLSSQPRKANSSREERTQQPSPSPISHFANPNPKKNSGKSKPDSNTARSHPRQKS